MADGNGGVKWCNHCGLMKSLCEFTPRVDRPGKFVAWCRQCYRDTYKQRNAAPADVPESEPEIRAAWKSVRIPAQPNARFGVPSIGVAA